MGAVMAEDLRLYPRDNHGYRIEPDGWVAVSSNISVNPVSARKMSATTFAVRARTPGRHEPEHIYVEIDCKTYSSNGIKPNDPWYPTWSPLLPDSPGWGIADLFCPQLKPKSKWWSFK